MNVGHLPDDAPIKSLARLITKGFECWRVWRIGLVKRRNWVLKLWRNRILGSLYLYGVGLSLNELRLEPMLNALLRFRPCRLQHC